MILYTEFCINSDDYCCFLINQSCPTLCNPMDCSTPCCIKILIILFSHLSPTLSDCMSHGGRTGSLLSPTKINLLFISSFNLTYTVKFSSDFTWCNCYLGEGNGTPLQCSCLENPRDWGAWRAAVCGSHRVGHDWSDLAVAAVILCLLSLVLLTI